MTIKDDGRDWASVKDIARENRHFSEATIRDLIYHSQSRINSRGEPIPPNGFAACMARVGRRILIDRRAFRAWIERGRQAPVAQLAERATTSDHHVGGGSTAMTKREAFAMAAMQGLLAGLIDLRTEGFRDDEVESFAVMRADALLAELAK